MAATAARSEAAADAAAATTAGKAGEAGAFVAEASPRRVPRAQRRRRPRRVSYRRTEISGFELSDLNENEVKIIKSNAPSLQQVSTKKRENEKKQTRF